MPKDTPIEHILERLARRVVTPRQAIEELVSMGQDRGDAGELVLSALGGSDLIETGADGRERYQPSGKLVSEVEAEMDRLVIMPLTKAQRRTVDELVAKGWPRESAEFMVIQSEEDVIEDTGCEMIAMVVHSLARSTIIARFWWSESKGLTCDNEGVAAWLATDGITTPPGASRVYPKDGRKFFDALRWVASSYVGITPPRLVRQQQGEPIR